VLPAPPTYPFSIGQYVSHAPRITRVTSEIVPVLVVGELSEGRTSLSCLRKVSYAAHLTKTSPISNCPLLLLIESTPTLGTRVSSPSLTDPTSFPRYRGTETYERCDIEINRSLFRFRFATSSGVLSAIIRLLRWIGFTCDAE
jgi:hypothetical protein